MWFVALCISIETCTSIENSIHLIGFQVLHLLLQFSQWVSDGCYLRITKCFLYHQRLAKQVKLLGPPIRIDRNSGTASNNSSKSCILNMSSDNDSWSKMDQKEIMILAGILPVFGFSIRKKADRDACHVFPADTLDVQIHSHKSGDFYVWLAFS